MSFLDRIYAANRWDIGGLRRFSIAGQSVGWVNAGWTEQLARWPDVFSIGDDAVTLAGEFNVPGISPSERSAAVDGVLQSLRSEGRFPGWRDEQYAVNSRWGDPALMTLERAAVPRFGVAGYGIHINGFVRTPDGISMWVGRRARDKPTDPGKLDQIVAGGQPAALSLRANVIKECAEEASIPERLARLARPVGTVTYALLMDLGLRPDVIFAYDLELPPDFVPVNSDGEVESFSLWPLDEVAARVRDSEDFKFNCALVIIDFLIRHGWLDPECSDYAEIVAGLRGREQFDGAIAGPHIAGGDKPKLLPTSAF